MRQQKATLLISDRKCTNIAKSDVDILRRGCMKFRELFIQITT